jgi:hypothetical protein
MGPQVYGLLISTVGRGSGWDAFGRAEQLYDQYLLQLGAGVPDPFIVSSILSGGKPAPLHCLTPPALQRRRSCES